MKLIALCFLVLGVFILVQISLPVLAFKFWESSLATDLSLASPQIQSEQVLGVSIDNSNNFPSFISNIKRKTPAPYDQFSISVPNINIQDALVIVDSNDLSKLAHLPGTALPGEKGNVFISGHSALPLLFRGDQDYGSIFAGLEKLKKGDQIITKVGQTEFRYQVLGFKIIDPKDTSVVNPPDSSGRFITLMTCVPPGLNTKRLVVIGKII